MDDLQYQFITALGSCRWFPEVAMAPGLLWFFAVRTHLSVDRLCRAAEAASEAQQYHMFK